jgi:hypothetical protein
VVEDNRLKLSISLEMPKEKEYKPTLMERVEAAKEKIEYGLTDRNAYSFLRGVYNCASKCYKENKKTPKVLEILKTLTSFMAKHGLHDAKGVDLVSEFVNNPEYEEDND